MSDTTTTDIARAHGHTGPTNCQDCGTTESVHFGSWYNPKTKEGGPFLQCCACGLKAGDLIVDHADCGASITNFVPHAFGTPQGQLAYGRILVRAAEAYTQGQHSATEYLDLKGAEVHDNALATVLESVGRAYAAAAINQVAQTLADKLDEETYLALGEIAATLDLAVVEDLTGANSDGEEESRPEVRVHHQAEGWTLPSLSPDVQACTANFAPEYKMPCPNAAIWKVAELHDMHATFSFWCDDHMPAERRRLAANPIA